VGPPPSHTTLTSRSGRRENAERNAALIRERDGQPVRVQTYMLPDGLPPPFDRWPQGGGKGSFVVMPDDTITFKPREVRT